MKTTMNFLKIGVILSVAALSLTACGNAAENSGNAPQNAVAATNVNVSAPQPTATIDELAVAREIYITSCSNCHKENGTGGKTNIDGTVVNADNLTTEKMKKMSDAKYIDYIENGVPDEGMPAFKDKLTERQIKDVVKYIRTEIQKQ